MEIIELIKKNKEKFGRVLSIDYQNLPYSIFDLSNNNEDLKKINIFDAKEFNSYLNKIMQAEGSSFGIGKYNENRTIYDHSDLFNSDEKRTLHLGIDLWTDYGVDVIIPYNGIIHSYNNNIGDGDYGPTIIIEHEIEGKIFYTLYGHLNENSLNNIKEGTKVKKGEKIGEIGNYPTNGNWPPHLHFEIILDMLNKKGDFLGVAKISEKNYWLNICPNPNLILNIKGLD